MISESHIKRLLLGHIGAEGCHETAIVAVICHVNAKYEVRKVQAVLDTHDASIEVCVDGRFVRAVASFKRWNDDLEEAKVPECGRSEGIEKHRGFQSSWVHLGGQVTAVARGDDNTILAVKD